jgi:transcriptional regulator with XRE-family HTH domain
MEITALTHFKNGAFYRARKERSLSQAALAALAGVQIVAIQKYESFGTVPKDLAVIAALEDALGLSYAELFPPEYLTAIQRKLGRRITRTFEVTTAMLETEHRSGFLLPSAEDEYMAKEMGEQLAAAMDHSLETITPRERRVLELRYGQDEKTYEEISNDPLASGPNRPGRGRMQQIEAKALRKLKHPSRSGNLRPFMEKT